MIHEIAKFKEKCLQKIQTENKDTKVCKSHLEPSTRPLNPLQSKIIHTPCLYLTCALIFFIIEILSSIYFFFCIFELLSQTDYNAKDTL